MKLHKSNFFVKIYEAVHNEHPNDLCSLFWTCFFFMVTLLAAILIVIGFIALIIIFILKFELYFLAVLLAAMVGCIIYVAFIKFVVVPSLRFVGSRKQVLNLGNSIADTWNAARGKYCTKITIID